MANTRFLPFALYLGVKVTQNVAQYALHQVTYAPALQSLKLLRPMVKEEMH